MAGTMGPMEGANLTVGPVFAPTRCVAHCVSVIAAHGVSLGVVFATTHPSAHSTPCIINTD